MDLWTALQAVILGVVEGLTEFLPISSTGHQIVVADLLGFGGERAMAFNIIIQLGAILAVMWEYRRKILITVFNVPRQPEAQRFTANLLIAFLPAVVIGFLAYGFIKTVLFETPLVICVALIIGGVLLLWLDRMNKVPAYLDADRYPFRVYFLIGLFQCLAMIPGVSRSGATIAGGLLLKTDKRSAAEFSFFLALPTMGAAVAYDLFKNRDVLDFSDLGLIAIGFIAAFVSALAVVRFLLDFVSKRGFGPFAWWRIVVGVAGIVGLAVTGAL